MLAQGPDHLQTKNAGRPENRHYYNIRYLTVNRADDSLYLKPNGWWSFELPGPIPSDDSDSDRPSQPGPALHLDSSSDQQIDPNPDNPEHTHEDQPEQVTPPLPETVRGYTAKPRSRQVSLMSHEVRHSSGISDLSTRQRLPESEDLASLTPRTRKRARKLNLPPQQEYMRSSLARALAPLPMPRGRLDNILSRILQKKK